MVVLLIMCPGISKYYSIPSAFHLCHKEIDEGHSCYTLKYVRNKPVKDLRDEQFLRLTQVSVFFREK